MGGGGPGGGGGAAESCRLVRMPLRAGPTPRESQLIQASLFLKKEKK